MADLNLDLDFFTHPKLIRLVGLLGRGSEMLPIKLWCYCGKYHAESGKLTEHSPQEIESVVGWWGKEGEAVKAMLKVGFLEKISNGFQVHDWAEKQGHIQALKIQAKRAAKARWDKMRVDRRNADSNAAALPRHCPVPDRTVPDLTVPKKSLTLGTTLREDSNGNSNSFIEEVVKYCGDAKSRVFYALTIQQHGEPLLREAFGELKMRVNEGADIANRGAYLVTLIKDWTDNGR